MEEVYRYDLKKKKEALITKETNARLEQFLLFSQCFHESLWFRT